MIDLRRTLLVAAVVLAATLLPMYREVWAPGLVPKSVGTWLIPALSALLPIAVLGRTALGELGWTYFSRGGVGVAVLGSLAMPVAFLLEGSLPGVPTTTTLVRGALLAGFTEELLMRGYAYDQLVRRAGWPQAAAMAVTALAFGLLHVPGAIAAGEGGNLLGTVAMTTAGGAWYAWLFTRWDRSLWVPVAMHTTMNLWWVVFSAGPTAGSGGMAALWGRVATITIVTVLTIRWTALRPTVSAPL